SPAVTASSSSRRQETSTRCTRSAFIVSPPIYHGAAPVHRRVWWPAMRPVPDEKFTPFMTALCFGRIEEDLILPYPKTEAKDVELLKNVLASIEQLLKPHEKVFRKWDRAGTL